jgi:hypothetical protein
LDTHDVLYWSKRSRSKNKAGGKVKEVERALWFVACVQSVLALRRFALRNFAHTNCCNAAYDLRLIRYPNMSSLNRSLPNKVEHFLRKMQTEEVTSSSQSVKVGNCMN